jgi:hypothetical protein
MIVACCSEMQISQRLVTGATHILLSPRFPPEGFQLQVCPGGEGIAAEVVYRHDTKVRLWLRLLEGVQWTADRSEDLVAHNRE